MERGLLVSSLAGLVILGGAVAATKSHGVERDALERTSLEVVRRLQPAKSAAADAPPAWIHTRIAGKCAYLYAEHEHEGFVTRDAPDGPRMAVAHIDLHSNIGGEAQVRTCDGTDSCGRTEKEVNVGCRHSCTYSTVRDPRYQTGSSPEQCIW